MPQELPDEVTARILENAPGRTPENRSDQLQVTAVAFHDDGGYFQVKYTVGGVEHSSFALQYNGAWTISPLKITRAMVGGVLAYFTIEQIKGSNPEDYEDYARDLANTTVDMVLGPDDESILDRPFPYVFALDCQFLDGRIQVGYDPNASEYEWNHQN